MKSSFDPVDEGGGGQQVAAGVAVFGAVAVGVDGGGQVAGVVVLVGHQPHRDPRHSCGAFRPGGRGRRSSFSVKDAAPVGDGLDVADRVVAGDDGLAVEGRRVGDADATRPSTS